MGLSRYAMLGATCVAVMMSFFSEQGKAEGSTTSVLVPESLSLSANCRTKLTPIFTQLGVPAKALSASEPGFSAFRKSIDAISAKVNELDKGSISSKDITNRLSKEELKVYNQLLEDWRKLVQEEANYRISLNSLTGRVKMTFSSDDARQAYPLIGFYEHKGQLYGPFNKLNTAAPWTSLDGIVKPINSNAQDLQKRWEGLKSRRQELLAQFAKIEEKAAVDTKTTTALTELNAIKFKVMEEYEKYAADGATELLLTRNEQQAPIYISLNEKNEPIGMVAEIDGFKHKIVLGENCSVRESKVYAMKSSMELCSVSQGTTGRIERNHILKNLVIRTCSDIANGADIEFPTVAPDKENEVASRVQHALNVNKYRQAVEARRDAVRSTELTMLLAEVTLLAPGKIRSAGCDYLKDDVEKRTGIKNLDLIAQTCNLSIRRRGGTRAEFDAVLQNHANPNGVSR